MIGFKKSRELDMAFNNLLMSMVEVQEYITEVLDYTGKVLTPAMEKNLVKLLKKYNVPCNDLKYDIKRLTDNPYYRHIRLNSVCTDTVRYERDVIRKRTLMSMNFHRPVGKYLFHYHPIGYFDTDVEMPVLKEGDRVWMSPAVSETESMGDGIERGRGKCLTMGLGIGVLPYLWLLKDEVESVTVVEINRDVINLFEEYIRPQFRTDKRLDIIHGNALDYYNEEFLSRFDYVYIDFWESTDDGLKWYTKLMEKKINLPYVDYWLEDTMLHEVKYIVASYLIKIYRGSSIAEYISSLDEESRYIAKKANRYFKARNDVIETENELLSIIHDKCALKEILSQ